METNFYESKREYHKKRGIRSYREADRGWACNQAASGASSALASAAVAAFAASSFVEASFAAVAFVAAEFVGAAPAVRPAVAFRTTHRVAAHVAEARVEQAGSICGEFF